MADDSSTLFPALLRYWRTHRGWSQLDLALAADVSARHISFLERGRSRPSDQMALRLAATLDLPLRERNALLRSAGFAPFYPEPGVEEALAEPTIARALDRMLRQHEPCPMVVMDAGWRILRMNRGAERLLALSGVPPERMQNGMEALFDPQALRPFVVGWPRVAAELVARLHRESLHDGRDRRLADLLERVLAWPGVDPAWRTPDFSRGSRATFHLHLRLGEMEARFLTTLMRFSAPGQVALEELQIESWFPLDDATEQLCAAVGVA